MTISQIKKQKKLALQILEWHGGQDSGCYAVGSCMLSASEQYCLYEPENVKGHANTSEEIGAVQRAINELRNLKKDANFPECVSAKDEKECNALALELEKYLK